MKRLFIIGILLLIYSQTAHAAIIIVNAGGDFQAALNAAACGDTIELQSGATFSGNFVLPDKGTCTNFITVETSNLAGIPPAGTRITPAYAGAMAKLVADSSLGYPALEADPNAHHFKFIGIEITNIGGSVVTQDLVDIGLRFAGNIPFLQHPHHIIFDRCWIHEATNDTTTPDSITTTAIRGFTINATDITITESRIAGFRAYQPSDPPMAYGVEASMDILFPDSALRVIVQDTYLEAWFCPVFFGGSGGESPNTATLTNPTWDSMTNMGSATFSAIPNLHVGDLVAFHVTGAPNVFQVAKVTGISGSTVNYLSWGTFDGDITGGNPLLQVPDSPGLAQWNGYLNQDITLQHNEFVLNFNSTEPIFNSSGDAPKGMIEIKMVKNLLIDRNIFEGWASGFTVTSRNQGGTLDSGGFPWSGVFNVTVSNNWWKKTPNWDRVNSYPIGGPALEDDSNSDTRSGPFTFTNNLVEIGIDAILAAMSAADNVTVTHNTYPGRAVAPDGSMVFGLGANSPNFIFRDNILANNAYGLDCQLSEPCWPGLIENHNVIIDNRTLTQQGTDGPLDPWYPQDFIAMGQAAVGWVNPSVSNYNLAGTSPYKHMASDGTDPGVNMSLLPSGGSAPVPLPPPHHHGR